MVLYFSNFDLSCPLLPRCLPLAFCISFFSSFSYSPKVCSIIDPFLFREFDAEGEKYLYFYLCLDPYVFTEFAETNGLLFLELDEGFPPGKTLFLLSRNLGDVGLLLVMCFMGTNSPFYLFELASLLEI